MAYPFCFLSKLSKSRNKDSVITSSWERYQVCNMNYTHFLIWAECMQKLYWVSSVLLWKSRMGSSSCLLIALLISVQGGYGDIFSSYIFNCSIKSSLINKNRLTNNHIRHTHPKSPTITSSSTSLLPSPLQLLSRCVLHYCYAEIHMTLILSAYPLNYCFPMWWKKEFQVNQWS